MRRNSWDYEFWDPEGKITEEQLKTLIDDSTKIFSDVGIMEYMFIPPGDAIDERVWGLFEEKGFQVYLNSVFSPSFSKEKLEQLQGRMQAYPKEAREYTWFWRDMKSFNDPRYTEALKRVEREKPIIILLHQQDLNQFTLRFLRELPYHPEIIRCDDFTLETEKVKEVVEIARFHNAVAVLGVIPSFKLQPTPLFQVWTKAYFFMFLTLNIFPTATFISWYSIRRNWRIVTILVGAVTGLIIGFASSIFYRSSVALYLGIPPTSPTAIVYIPLCLLVLDCFISFSILQIAFVNYPRLKHVGLQVNHNG